MTIKKLFIANRGEIAVRAAQACEKRKIRAVIPYSFSDSESLVTRMADNNSARGWELAVLGGTSAEETYANPKIMLQTALLHGCDAIFLGYGFLSESADFVRQCEAAGLRVLAASPEAMEMVGNKISAREIAKKIKIGPFARIPILEGTGNLQVFEETVKAAKALGYPVMLKDPDTGGGVGNIIANNEVELQQAYTTLRMSRNNKALFLERYIARAVHVEVQIAADNHGNVVSLGERDCTMQRRSQKVIEESPSPHISERMSRLIQSTAVNYAKYVGYKGVGTWEFIIDLDRKGRNGKAWYFMEVNPRIQVEHGVTEEQDGIDIINTMIDIAEGKKLPFTQEQIRPQGHTIEVRVYAEKPEERFKQSSGHLQVLNYPAIKGVRIDKGAEQGDEISPWFDPTICKLIAHSATREEARHRLSMALLHLDIVGVQNNRDFLMELLNTDEFRNAQGTTSFIEQWWQKQLQKKIYAIGGIVSRGTFSVYPTTRTFKPMLLPQQIAVPSRRSSEPVSYSQYYEAQKQKSGQESAAEFGIVERDGIQFVLYELDDRFAAGTLGVAEGIVFEDACRLAYKRNLPLVTISRSGGARQHENTLALFQMGATVHALNRYPSLFHINIYSGGVYGGVPASFAGVADVQIGVNAKETRIGFTGPYITAKSLGKQPKSFSAEDSYQELPEGTHTALHSFQMRNIDILSASLEEASDKITHLLHILRIPSTITDSNKVFATYEHIGFHQMPGTAQRFDRPGVGVFVWLRNKIGSLFGKRKKPGNGKVNGAYPQLSISQRRKVLMHVDRPTAADFIDKNAGVFDDATAFTSVLHVDSAEQFPPIISAVAQLGDRPVFVLGQQTQRVVDEKTEKRVKVYDPQKPADWEYMERMIAFAKRLHLPIILIGDTLGADCLPDSEDRNQSHKIANVIKLLDIYPYPVISINIGFKGSGGGETFIRPFDAAADFENALSYVSDPMVQYWILTGRWIDKMSPAEKQQELTRYVEQLKDSTAQSRVQTHQIDAIIKEGKGGAHVDPTIVAVNLRQWLSKQLPQLEKYSTDELLTRRHTRIENTLNTVTVEAERR
jgi:acetyl/propionyl-CoA carboxylase alpha subunit/acetyl-CoA carboxylase alpha subunit